MRVAGYWLRVAGFSRGNLACANRKPGTVNREPASRSVAFVRSLLPDREIPLYACQIELSRPAIRAGSRIMEVDDAGHVGSAAAVVDDLEHPFFPYQVFLIGVGDDAADRGGIAHDVDAIDVDLAV